MTIEFNTAKPKNDDNVGPDGAPPNRPVRLTGQGSDGPVDEETGGRDTDSDEPIEPIPTFLLRRSEPRQNATSEDGPQTGIPAGEAPVWSGPAQQALDRMLAEMKHDESAAEPTAPTPEPEPERFIGPVRSGPRPSTGLTTGLIASLSAVVLAYWLLDVDFAGVRAAALDRAAVLIGKDAGTGAGTTPMAAFAGPITPTPTPLAEIANVPQFTVEPVNRVAPVVATRSASVATPIAATVEKTVRARGILLTPSAAPQSIHERALGNDRPAAAKINTPPATKAPEPTNTSAVATPDPAEIVALIARAETKLMSGDVVSARLLFERAARSGSAAAAHGAAKTYDPICFAKLGVHGPAADPEAALDWYGIAVRGGANGAKGDLRTLREWLGGGGATNVAAR